MNQIANYILMLKDIYFYMILIYVLMSWLPSVKESYIGELLGKLVDPYLTPFRRFIPPIGGILDISPIVALIALDFVARGIIAVLNFFVR